MVKINEDEVLLSKRDLHVLIGAAAATVLDSYNVTKNLKDLFMMCASDTNIMIKDHIWGKKRMPEEYLKTAKNLIRIEDDSDESPKESYEDKQAICRLLLAALQKTRAYHDLTDLLYDPYSEKVQAKFARGGFRLINTECDSGIAMINDILAHI